MNVQRRNPLRLLVTKETQLRVLWLVWASILACSAGAFLVVRLSHQWFWSAILLFVVGTFISLWVSRQITGPLYRLEKHLEAILSGAVEGKPLKFRESDHLDHLAELMNQLVAKAHPSHKQ